MEKYRSLGLAVFVYALIASGTLLPAFFGEGWPEAVNAALWVLHVIAGFGLIRGNEWGRVLILVVTGGSLLAMLVLFAFGAERVYSTLSMVLFFGGVPTVAIFVWALVIGQPAFKEVEIPPTTKEAEVRTATESVRKPWISLRTLHDIAYISYIILGLVSLWTASLEPEPNIIGFLVLIPFGIPMLLALVLGPGISLFLWRDYRLVGLTMLTIGTVIALNTLREETWLAFLIPYGAICTAMGIIWFTKYRKHF